MPKSVRVPVTWVDRPIEVTLVAAFCIPMGIHNRIAQRDLSRLKTFITPDGSPISTIIEETPMKTPIIIMVFPSPIVRISLAPSMAPARKEAVIMRIITASSKSLVLAAASVSTKKAIKPLPKSVARPLIWADLSKRSATVENAFKYPARIANQTLLPTIDQ